MKNVPSNLISYNKLVGVGGDDDDVSRNPEVKAPFILLFPTSLILPKFVLD